MFSPPGFLGSVEISEKNRFREENPSQGISVTRPRRFRKQIREDFPPSFVRSSLFFGLQSFSFLLAGEFVLFFFYLINILFSPFFPSFDPLLTA